MSEESEFSPTPARSSWTSSSTPTTARPRGGAPEAGTVGHRLWGTARSIGFDAPADGLFEDMLWARLSLALDRTPALPTSPNGAQ
jgi:hypothetical protein